MNGNGVQPRSRDAPASHLVTSELESDIEEEIDISETIVLREKSPRHVRTLLTGLPSPSEFFPTDYFLFCFEQWLIWEFKLSASILSSLVTFGINVLLLYFAFDQTFTAKLYYSKHELSFARVGYISHDSANIFIREPNSTKYPIILSYRYVDSPLSRDLPHRPFGSAWKLAGSISELTNYTDFTTSFTITGLDPERRYQYAFSNSKTGYFITAPPPGSYPSRSESDGKLVFVHSSCIIPRFPYTPFAHPLSVAGYRHLGMWLSKLRPAFMMFLGDFIYIDNPHRHGSSVEDYRRAYRQTYGSPDWKSASKVDATADSPEYDLPWLHVYDDHEIANDWNGNVSGVFPAAFDPYLHYHLGPNPPLPKTERQESRLSPETLAFDTTPTWNTFTHGPASFFLLDTRRYRNPPNMSDPYDASRSILGAKQLAALIAWLDAPPAPGIHWKLVISSVPFTKNWRVNAADTWSGYLSERQRILEAMWTAQARDGAGVLVLSGDRHEFAATAFPPPRVDVVHGRRGMGTGVEGRFKEWPLSATVHEFSTSPLSQFYLPVRSYKQMDEEDVCLKYIPEGNSKFGVVEIEGLTGSGQSILRYRVFIDGVEAWSHVLVSGGIADLETGGLGAKARAKAWNEGVWG